MCTICQTLKKSLKWNRTTFARQESDVWPFAVSGLTNSKDNQKPNLQRSSSTHQACFDCLISSPKHRHECFLETYNNRGKTKDHQYNFIDHLQQTGSFRSKGKNIWKQVPTYKRDAHGAIDVKSLTMRSGNIFSLNHVAVFPAHAAKHVMLLVHYRDKKDESLDLYRMDLNHLFRFNVFHY